MANDYNVVGNASVPDDKAEIPATSYIQGYPPVG
jgi:hypothetical protein